MSGKKETANRDKKVARPDAAGGAAAAPQEPGGRAARPTTDEALARAARAEERLVRAERRIEWLESRNVSDEVTGLLNRRGLNDALERALARARRYGETGSLLLVDLLRHEALVEERGVAAGDYVLAAVGNILHRHFREVDYVARLEGGRFAVLLLQISDEDSHRRAIMLKEHLAEVTVPWDGEDIAIHVRAGVVCYAQNDGAEDLLERGEAELEEREQRIARLRKPAQ